MPLSKERNKERMRQFRLHAKEVQPKTPVVQPKLHQQLERQGLVMAGNKVVGITKVTLDVIPVIPRYNPAVHKAGDRVLVLKGKRWVETVIPELDAGGQPYY